MLVLRSFSPPIPRETPDDDPRLSPPLLKGESLKERVRVKVKELIIEEELRRRRYVVLPSFLPSLPFHLIDDFWG
jgi:hypothetical protein